MILGELLFERSFQRCSQAAIKMTVARAMPDWIDEIGLHES